MKKGLTLIALISTCAFTFAQEMTVVKPKKGGPRYSSHAAEAEVVSEGNDEGEIILYGKIISSRTSMPVDARVDIFRNSDFMNAQGESAANGEFTTPLSDYGLYLISISAPGYIATSDTVWVLNEKRKVIDKSFHVVPVEVGLTVQLSNIHFEFGKAELTTASYHELDKTVTFLRENHGAHFEIGGHTDRIGPPENNLRLSHDRAVAVVKYLTSHGVDPSQLIARGYGDTEPINTDGTREAEASNRRVELTVLKVSAQGVQE